MLRPTLRRVVLIASLTAAWCALWGEVSLANLASGFAVAVAILALRVGPPATGRVRLVPLARFSARVAVDLLVSTVSVAREILTPTDHTDESVIAVRVPTDTRTHLLMLVLAVTVTPGTAVVDTDPDTGTLYLHLLHHDRRDATEAHVRRLAELACQALPERAHPTAAPGATR